MAATTKSIDRTSAQQVAALVARASSSARAVASALARYSHSVLAGGQLGPIEESRIGRHTGARI